MVKAVACRATIRRFKSCRALLIKMEGQLKLTENKRNRLIEDSLLLSSMAPEMYYAALGLMESLPSGECRILTPEDSGLIPVYLEIFVSRLKNIAPLYPQEEIEKAITLYTQEFVQQHLVPNRKKRFAGHFNRDSLDGILIEGFDKVNAGTNRTLINWVMARQSGLGIGSALVEDCIQRAKIEKKQVVALAVSLQNKSAQRLYEKLGFKADITYNEDRMLLMNFYIE